jgi:hypothetical protein
MRAAAADKAMRQIGTIDTRALAALTRPVE